MTVGLVLVSHVAEIAAGIRRLATQMAPAVRIETAGGTDDGDVGTSYDATLAAIEAADDGDGVVIVYDLGSAAMTAELAMEAVGSARAQVVDAPMIEAAVAAATTAAGGADLDAVAAAATAPSRRPEAPAATGTVTVAPDDASPNGSEPTGSQIDEPEITERVRLRNRLGLHARPAAAIVAALAGVDASVRIGPPGTRGVDARSVLALVGLGLRGSSEVQVTARGPAAGVAVRSVVALISDGFGELGETVYRADDGSGSAAGEPAAPGVLVGVPAAPGIAAGPVWRVRPTEPEVPDREGVGVGVERARLRAATERAAAAMTGDFAAAHRALLADPLLRDRAEAAIAAGAAAESAWWRAVEEASQLLRAADPLAAERVADLREVGLTVLAELDVAVGPRLGAIPAGAVVVTDELLPGDVDTLASYAPAAVVTAGGGATAHATILARGLGLPMVVGLGPVLEHLVEGASVIVDGDAGTVDPDPTPEALARTRAAAATERRRRDIERAATRLPVHGPDGRHVPILANIATVADAHAARDFHADGVGLLRTEFAYLSRSTLPTEDEQVADLTAILDALRTGPVVCRTLDIGGDKPLAGLALDPRRHGMLGERGIRLAQTHPALLRTQLRAVLRAAAGFAGTLSVMAPMVTEVSEAVEFRRTIREVAAELDAEGTPHRPPDRVGVMIEVPAAALLADELCAAVDFVSVGSNDLAQYVLAADRDNAAVAHLYRPSHPAVWRLLDQLVPAARAAGCPVAVCGELAGEPEAAQRLVELGVSELSMAPVSIPRVKAHLRAAFGSADPA